MNSLPVASPTLILIAGSLIFFMQIGFAMLEAGQTRAKNSVNVLMKNTSDFCVGALAFWLVGYGLMFGKSNGWFGTNHFAPSRMSDNEFLLMFFQLMFAATSATIVSGAVAERVKYLPYLLASAVTTGVVYAVFGAWAWGGYYGGHGWLASLGFIDFAGSAVVHAVGGWTALAAVIVLKPRLGRFSSKGEARLIPGHNLSLVALGGLLLWVGWFGFNAGSLLNTDTQALGRVLINTHLAGCAALVSTVLLLKLIGSPLLITRTINGALGGLVAVTASAAYIHTWHALVIGAIGAVVVVVGDWLLTRMRIDDVVGAVSVHAFCGTWGTIAVGIFAAKEFGDLSQLIVQLIGAASAFVWAFGTSFALYWTISKTMGLRVDSLTEQRGLDIVEHYEVAYPEFQAQLHSQKV